jgi:hypothetical protein
MLRTVIILYYALPVSWFAGWYAIEFSFIFIASIRCILPIRHQRVAGRQVPRADDEVLGLEVFQLGRFRSRRVARLVGAAVGSIGRRWRRAQNAAIRRVVRSLSICLYLVSICLFLYLCLSTSVYLSLCPSASLISLILCSLKIFHSLIFATWFVSRLLRVLFSLDAGRKKRAAKCSSHCCANSHEAKSFATFSVI